MKQSIDRKAIALVLAIILPAAGCSYAIPSRSSRAVAVSETPVYPIQVAVFPFVDKRPAEQRISSKRRSWPGSKGRLDFYGKNVEQGLAKATAEYLTQSRVFQQASVVDYAVNESLLESRGARALLTANIEKLNTGFTVEKWILILAFLPIPATSLGLVIWPKDMNFDAVLDDVTLKDLQTGKVVWQGRIEVGMSERKKSAHVMPKWYLGETAEMAAKELVRQLVDAKISF